MIPGLQALQSFCCYRPCSHPVSSDVPVLLSRPDSSPAVIAASKWSWSCRDNGFCITCVCRPYAFGSMFPHRLLVPSFSILVTSLAACLVTAYVQSFHQVWALIASRCQRQESFSNTRCESCGLSCRQGSSDEVALLVAEFELLDSQLANLCMAVDSQEAILINEDDLESVAIEIPDMRSRLGIG